MNVQELESILNHRLENNINDNTTIAVSIYYLALILKEKNIIIEQPIRVQNNDLYNI